MHKIRLPKHHYLALRLQQLTAWIVFPLCYLGSVFFLAILRGYRIDDIKRIRQQYRHIATTHKKPLLICANHLTKIDSLILLWGLSSLGGYLANFKTFAWNLPERDRFKHNLFFRFVCYIGCCIPISRGGDRNVVNQSMDKIKFLLQSRRIAMIFPEGKRSVIGKIDTKDYTYGVGRLVKSVESCDVLCIYMRGRSQKLQSGAPAYGERFYFDLASLHPTSELKGVRATKDIASQIINQLARMEETYFAQHRQ